MKIAFLHMTMGLVDRGSERVVGILASELAKNHEVHVLQAGKVTPEKYRAYQIYKMSQVPLPAPRNVLDKVKRRLKLDQESIRVREFTNASLTKIGKIRPDILVAINGSDQIRILKTHFPHIPVVAFGHAGIGMHDRATLKAKPSLFVALSPRARAWADMIASKETKLATIPNPFFEMTPSKNIVLTLPRPIVLTVGALSSYKNILDVISAVRQLNASLILIGDGEQHDEVARALSTLPKCFKWLQHVDPQDMASYYQAADVFCLVPDKQESFGTVYLEAMRAGLPIVASHDAVRRGIIGPQGFYVAPHDISGMVDRIIKAVELGKLDYQSELRQYNPRVVVKAIEKELYDLIKA